MRLLMYFVVAFCVALPSIAAANDVVLRVEQQLGEPADGTLTSRESEEAVRFRVSVDYRCPEDNARASLFMSVGNESVAADLAESPQAVIVKVPAGQLTGVRESAKCEVPGARVLEDQAQVFATLSCVAEEQRASRTVVAPLSVWFDCPGEETE